MIVATPHPMTSDGSDLPTRRARPAFSLIELLTVLTVAGIVIAMSISRIATYTVQQRVVRAASAVQRDIEVAFAIAARNRRPVQMTWTPSTMTFKVTDREGTTTFRQTLLGSNAYGLVTGQITTSSNAIEVFPNGLASDTLLITVAAARDGLTHSRRLHMSRAGLVRVD
jgi:prepilin-type N-terminal cleavage/methylation domain-containing protein